MKTVLVVEDDRGLRDTYVDFLSGNYRVIAASNGIEALKVLVSESIDAVLMDVQMPSMDGIQALIRIRKTRRQMPVIIMSGRELSWFYDEDTEITLAQALEQAEATAFYPKSNMNHLRQLFERYLG